MSSNKTAPDRVAADVFTKKPGGEVDEMNVEAYHRSVRIVPLNRCEERSAFQSEYGLYIGGKWLEPATGGKFPSVNPADGTILACVSSAGAPDVDKAVAAARTAFGRWKETTSGERSLILLKIADRLEKELQRFALFETLDAGKPIRQTLRIDLPRCIDHFRYFAAACRLLDGKGAATPGKRFNIILREPVGVVGQITPFNYPLLMAAWKIAPALAAGNTVVLKPPEEASLSTLELMKLIGDLLPEGVVNVVTGTGSGTGTFLARHPGVRLVAFTGSSTAGQKVMRAAASHLAPIIGEFGGKNPQIVFPDADLETCVAGVVSGFCLNQGQLCTAGSRLFLHRDIFDDFLDRLRKELANLKIGDPRHTETMFGPLISRAQLRTVEGYIRKGRLEGATLWYGGKRCVIPTLEKGYFLEPAVFIGVRNQMCIAREEIFGPVLGIIRWDEEEKMIREVNDSPYGLTAGIWTADLGRALRTASLLDSGTVWINNYNIVAAGYPFGGYKNSGFGREGSVEALNHYTQAKSIFIDYGR